MMSSMGGGVFTKTDAKESEIRIVVTRADGRIEDYGRVSYWHKNPLRRLAGNIAIRWRRWRMHK